MFVAVSDQQRERYSAGANGWWYRPLMVAILLLLCACERTPIAEDKTQKQANEIAALLNANGIGTSVEREVGGRGRYTVRVKPSNESRSRGLLVRKGLHGDPKASFEELIEKKGFVPDSRDVEALRVDHAMAVEVQEVLETHPGIAVARVIVRSKYSGEDSAPGVAVVLQVRPESEVAPEQIVSLVSQVVPGILAENVQVSIHESENDGSLSTENGVFFNGEKIIPMPLVPFLSNFHVPEEEYGSISLVLLALMILVGLVGAAIGYWYSYYQQSKREFDQGIPDFQSRAFRLDQPKTSLPEL